MFGFREGTAQAFTPTIPGLLDSIDIFMESTSQIGDVNASIVETDALGFPTSLVLGSTTLPSSHFLPNDWNKIDFSGENILLIADIQVALVLDSDPNDAYEIKGGYFDPGGPYIRGDFFQRLSPDDPWTLQAGQVMDMAFRQYVEPSAIPEPTSILLLVTGALGLLGYGWRRKRHSEPNSTLTR
jgi:hypothetical protein